ncbi:MAG TPA: hypothetical protein DCX09_12575 [Gammaproteobacteria bacterium]|nr:hypothetical protein [Gammaproteobacteria bacterium]HAU25496.1 hypothetical protein [Gammaproteobacteria bacterium]HBJ88854.1 hypothetical protein [Gammaproteobacteria bacterium]HCA35065.1 hypothetical protein [Gammaproteobacteria bacterium]HCL72610.1 hypothetical protein [Gammaproteobacteria bacterium]
MPNLFASNSSSHRWHYSLIFLLGLLFSTQAAGHGGVAFEDDLCVINIDFMQAHFTVFQPETSESTEYCEDIPNVTRSVFVMEYLHDLLTEMVLDFRIVRDVNDVGRFASWEDIEAIDDLEAATVFYEAARMEEGGFYRTSYEFLEKGTYIGVVTADHPTEDRNYNAVFYFRVGGRDWGTIPIFLALGMLLQLGYWASTGGWQRMQERMLG